MVSNKITGKGGGGRVELVFGPPTFARGSIVRPHLEYAVTVYTPLYKICDSYRKCQPAIKLLGVLELVFGRPTLALDVFNRI